jgi:hypothetical protein
MPNATSTMTAAGHLNATTTFTAGDLVFAKLAAGGDNLNTYAWHLVTTSEAVDSVQGPAAGTTSALRLDSASARAQFVASSVFAKIATPASGPIDSGVENPTVFSIGDYLFGKVTANAANLNAYAWHFVSNGATGATSTSLRLDNVPANLNTSTVYVVTAGTGIKDVAGNALAATSTLTFTTGGQSGTNNTPPFVQSSQPQQGNQTFALNSPIKITFSQTMKSDSSANSVATSSVVRSKWRCANLIFSFQPSILLGSESCEHSESRRWM